jgi:hypothetical protein
MQMLNPQESILETYLASIPQGTRMQVEIWRIYFICLMSCVESEITEFFGKKKYSGPFDSG